MTLLGRLTVLRHREFRRLLAGRTVSVLGDGLYTVAAMWLVFDLTGSTAFTGLAGFLTQIPGVLSMLVGPIVDRARLGRVLTLSELAQGVVVLVVPLAWLTGSLSVAVVLATMPVLSLVGLFAGPAQTAAVPRLVPDDSLVRANAAATAVGKTVDALARGIGGALIVLVGAVGVYVVDAATFALAALLFFSLDVPDTSRGGTGEDDSNQTDGFDRDAYVRDLREGIEMLTGSVLGLMLVGSLFANFLFGVAFAVLPSFAAGLGGAGTYGLLLAGLTAGTVGGSLLSSWVESVPLGRSTIVGLSASGLLFAVSVWVARPVLSVALFTLSRVPVGIYNVSVMATLQSGVPDDRLGRVSSVLSTASSLVSPAGVLLGGVLGELVGSWTVLLASAAGTVLTATYWLLVPSLRTFESPTGVEPGSLA
ncbi:MFS transporter [Haloarchaeobius sp. HME9146]|uniref:MFS transporter n=1 Tax=Haloarchaeobius sp. HME9146 TaxID=2978732 RepID=UPI0021C17C7E|nr:MFS transporter [Haloarchaeobius sp. HME9146]MCT9096177.1 MFS transporter [Haloarchaeobius sp. HME9146]